MSNSEILRLQISYFSRCLETAINNHMAKIIFIHGVGNGVLKYEIRKYLSAYPNVAYEDASMNKYGVGATEVKIFYNK
jgi:dsDNA-specific endonuclease/ATPase MutS2